LGESRLPEEAAPTLALRSPPAWVFLHGPRSHLSSTAIRNGMHVRRDRQVAAQLQSEPEAANFIPTHEA
jgi:nicotinate-nucleotide adenylyltransferase